MENDTQNEEQQPAKEQVENSGAEEGQQQQATEGQRQQEEQQQAAEGEKQTGIAAGEDKPIVEKPIGFTDFLKERGIETEKLAEKAKPAEKAKEEQQAITKPVKVIYHRDLSKIPEKDHHLFKNMSIDSFKRLQPIYLDYNRMKKEYEETKKEKEALENQVKSKPPASVYGHPRAFMLSEDYQQKSVNNEAAQGILDHWQLQMIKLESGEKWQDIDIDPKTGNFVLGQPQEPTPEAKLRILRQVN